MDKSKSSPVKDEIASAIADKNELVARFTQMGFAPIEIENALDASNNDPDLAYDFLCGVSCKQI